MYCVALLVDDDDDDDDDDNDDDDDDDDDDVVVDDNADDNDDGDHHHHNDDGDGVQNCRANVRLNCQVESSSWHMSVFYQFFCLATQSRHSYCCVGVLKFSVSSTSVQNEHCVVVQMFVQPVYCD